MPRYKPFDRQSIKSALKLVNEASIPYLLWSPVSSGNTRAEKHILGRDVGVGIYRIEEILHFVAVLLRRVGDTVLEPKCK